MSREERNRLGLLALTVAWSLAMAFAGGTDVVLYLAPALLLALPLAFGRYVGEDVLVAAGDRLRAPRRRLAASRARPRWTFFTFVPRGGRLLASSLAERGPPLAAAL